MTLHRAATHFDALKSFALFLTAASRREFLCPQQFCRAHGLPSQNALENAVQRALGAHCALLTVICHHWRYPLLPLLLLPPEAQNWKRWRRGLAARVLHSARLMGCAAPQGDTAQFIAAEQARCFAWARAARPCNDNGIGNNIGSGNMMRPVTPAICDMPLHSECARPGFLPDAICCPPPRQPPQNRFAPTPGLSPARPEIRRASWLRRASDG